MNSIISLVPGILAVTILGCGTEEWPSTERMTSVSEQDAFNLSDPASSGAAEYPGFSDWSTPVHLGPMVNSASMDIEVSISRDNLSLYLASNRSGNFDIWVSQRASVDESWGLPENLGPTINTSAREQGMFLSRDGHRLYFFSDDGPSLGGLDIYVSRRRDQRDGFGWQTPENLGSGVNASANETLPVVFEDDLTGTTTMYFTSNRIGVSGTDIYASVLQPNGTFGQAALVGELSSNRRDATVAIRRDGLEMFLASDREGSLGGAGTFDMWVSTRANTSDAWSTPVNLGSIVNSAGGESRGALSFDGKTLYIISDRPGSLGLDIWVSTRTKLKDSD